MEQIPTTVAEVIDIARASGWVVQESTMGGFVLGKASRQAVVQLRGGVWAFGYEPEVHVIEWLEVRADGVPDITRILRAA